MCASVCLRASSSWEHSWLWGRLAVGCWTDNFLVILMKTTELWIHRATRPVLHAAAISKLSIGNKRKKSEINKASRNCFLFFSLRTSRDTELDSWESKEWLNSKLNTLLQPLWFFLFSVRSLMNSYLSEKMILSVVISVYIPTTILMFRWKRQYSGCSQNTGNNIKPEKQEEKQVEWFSVWKHSRLSHRKVAAWWCLSEIS